MPAGAPRGRTRGHPDRLDEYRFALLSTVPRQASRTGGSLQTGVQGRLAHELQVLFGARSICGMKITGPFGDRNDGRVDRTRGEVRKDRTVDDMKPRHACDRRVGTDDGAGIRSHPAGSDRPAIRRLYSHAALLRSRRGNVPDGTVWASVLQSIVPSRHSCAFKRLKRSGCRFPRIPIRFHGGRDASRSF